MTHGLLEDDVQYCFIVLFRCFGGENALAGVRLEDGENMANRRSSGCCAYVSCWSALMTACAFWLTDAMC